MERFGLKRRRGGILRKFFVLCLAPLILLQGVRISGADSHAATYGSEFTWIYRCNRQAEGTIALTFDDGPHPRLTPIILDILKEYGIRATFFIVGENAEYYPDVVRRIRDEGHEIGNHTYSHVQTTKVTASGLEEELLKCESAIGGISDTRPRLFRPPQGSIDPNLGNLCSALGYRVVLWSIDTRDWDHVPSGKIAETVLGKVKNGDIILMHDFIGHDSPTPAALKQIIPALLARGYEFATISELLDVGNAVDGE